MQNLSEMPERLNLTIAGKQVPVLDGIRGFAVSFVILYHFFPKTLSVDYNFPLFEVWDSFWLMGWSGVDLFFVLSGFLITGILYKAKGKPNYFRNFYIRRFLRIFPIYYLLLIVVLIVMPLITKVPAPENSIFYWLYLSNFDTELNIPFHSVLCVAWSLAIEEQYYMFYPTLVYFSNYKRWIRMLIFFILLSIVLRFAGHFFEFFTPRQAYHFTFAHFDGIALGGLIRLLLFKFDENKKIILAYIKFLPLILVVSLAVDYYCGHQVLAAYAKNKYLGHVSFYPLMYLAGYTLNSLAYGGIILWCIFNDGRIFSFFNHPIMRSIGKYSYAMYLLQYPAKTAFVFVLGLFNLQHSLPTPVYAIGVFISCYCIARLSWLFFEGPINGLKDRFTKH